MKSKTFSLECYASELAKILESLLPAAVIFIFIIANSGMARAGGPLCNQASDCDDFNVCTIDSCDSILGCQYLPVTCIDGDSCTLDFCDVLTGCAFPPDPLCFPNQCDTLVCDDGILCTADACDSLLGCFFTPDNIICDDGIGCTEDFCDPVDDCSYIAHDDDCDDGVFCTDDICDGLTGCSNAANDALCDDAIVCTDEFCDPLDDCNYTADDSKCDDLDSCTIDFCDGLQGCLNTDTCATNPCDTILCDDGDDCTDDACDNGLCVYTPVTCDDVNACTNDFCIGGTCNNTAIDCNDADDCTVDGCDIASGCFYNPAICDDSDACTTDDCVSPSGCVFTPLNCDDGDACTTDDCGPGGCLNAAINCDDGNACTTDACDNGLCSNDAISCDDSDSCTADICDPLAGCINTFDSTLCPIQCPLLSFTYNPVCEGGTTTITNTSTGVDAGATYYFDVDNDGTIEYTVPAAALPADSSLTVNAGTLVLNVIVVNSNGCSDTLLITETTPANPELDFDYTPVCGGQTATIVNNSTGVDAGATYYLDLDNDGSIDFSVPAADLPADSSFTVGAGTATFSVIVVNSTGCSDTLTTTVTTPEKPVLGIDFASSPCAGEAVLVTNLSTGVDAGAIYYLDVNSNGTINITVPAADLPADSSIVLPVPAGTYGFTAYVVNSTGCSDTLVSSVTVLDQPELAFDIASSGCQGGTTTITNNSTGVDAGATYYVDINNDGTIDLTAPAAGLPSDSTLTINGLPGAFDYTIVVVNSTGCSDTLTGSATILEKPELGVSFASVPCEGEAVLVTNLSTGVDADAIYYLDVNSNGSINLIIPAADLPTDSSIVLPVPAGTYGFTAYVVNSTGCSDTLVSAVTVNDKPELSFDYNYPCAGAVGTVTNTSTGVDAGAIYYIDADNDGTTDVTVPAADFPVDSSFTVGAGTATFTVIVVNSTGCSDTLTMTVTTPESPELAFDISSACEGQDVTITNLSTGVDAGAIYYLDVNNNGTIDLTLPAAGLPGDSTLVLPAPAGTFDFTVVVVNSTGCSDTLISTVTVLEKPELNFDYTPVCDGETMAVTNLSTGVDAGATYHLDFDNDGTIDISVPAADLPADSSFTVAAGTATFTIYVVNSTGCSDTLTMTVTTPEKPQLSFDYAPVCAGETMTVTNTSTGVDAGATYYADLDNDGTIDISVPASDLPADSSFTAGAGTATITIIVVNSTGCSDTLTITSTTPDCNDGNACTDDECNNLVCTNTPIVCDDGDACTTDGCDPLTGCLAIPLICDDGDACTDDGCDSATGCTTTPTVCDDGDACTDDACDSATGCTTTPAVCDDGDACTTDGCDSATGCTTTPTVCDDGDACTTDGCDPATGCTTTPVVCDDSDLCTDDACDSQLGCVFTPAVCDDGDLCTTDKCEFGVCVFAPMTCDDGSLCTSDICVGGTCEFNPISCDDGDTCTTDSCDALIGCINTYTCFNPCDTLNCDDNDACNGVETCDPVARCVAGTPLVCDDSDSCTTDSCDPLLGCVFTSIPNCPGGCTTPVDVSIDDVTPENCQGGRKLSAVSASAASYAWSSGETSADIDAAPGATYSVTVTDASGCTGTASYTVAGADELLSSYTILFKKEVRMNNNTVLSGGVGVSNIAGKLKIGGGSDITAAGTFAKADALSVSGSSSVTTQIPDAADLAAPAFEASAQCDAGQSLQIPDNTTITLSGSQYNDVTIGEGCTVSFTGGEIDFDNLFSKDNATVRFTAPCVKLRICEKLQLGSGNSFNPDAAELIAFVGQDVTINGGSTVIADIHMAGGKMTVNSGTLANPNSLTGLFTGNFLESGDFTTWQQNTACNPACSLGGPSDCDPAERVVTSFTLVDATTDLDLGPLNDGDIIDLALTGPISVRANVCHPGNVESVRFFLDGTFFKVENLEFYTIAGDNNGNYNAWNVQPGTYTITATPYSGDNGSGLAGTSLSITITITGTPKWDGGAAAIGQAAEQVELKAFPNPFSDKLNIEFMLAEDSRATLELFSVAGQKLATLFDGNVKAGELHKTEFIPGSISDGMVIYRLQTSSGTYFNKAVLAR